MRVPVQTSFGVSLLPLPVVLEEQAHRGARDGASERAREEAFYQGFPESRGREFPPERSPRPASQGWRPLSEWMVFKWFSRRAAPSHRG